jgi:hypothetical protein
LVDVVWSCETSEPENLAVVRSYPIKESVTDVQFLCEYSLSICLHTRFYPSNTSCSVNSILAYSYPLATCFIADDGQYMKVDCSGSTGTVQECDDQCSNCQEVQIVDSTTCQHEDGGSWSYQCPSSAMSIVYSSLLIVAMAVIAL